MHTTIRRARLRALGILELALACALLSACGGGGGGGNTAGTVEQPSTPASAIPTITAQPADERMRHGQDMLAFGVGATGTGLSYQWELSRDGGASFAPLSGATDPVLHLAGVSGAQIDVSHVRVVVRNNGGQVLSRAAQINRLSQRTMPHGLQLPVQSTSASMWIDATTRIVMHATGDVQLETPLTDHWELVRSDLSDTPDIGGVLILAQGGGKQLAFRQISSARPALLLASDDRGKSWRQVPLAVPNAHSIQAFASGDVLLASSDDKLQLWRARAGDFSWSRLPAPYGDGGQSQQARMIAWAYDSQGDRAWLMSDEKDASGLANLVLRRTDDHGTSWIPMALPSALTPAGHASGDSYKLLASPKGDLLLSATLNQGGGQQTRFWISQDQGRTWEDRSTQLLPALGGGPALVEPQFCGDALMADTARNALSTDGGRQWTRLPGPVSLTACTPGGELLALVETDGRLRRSRSNDRGRSWTTITPPDHPWTIVPSYSAAAPVLNGRGGFLAMDVDRHLFLAGTGSWTAITLPAPAAPLNLPDWQNPTFMSANGAGLAALYLDKRWFVSQTAGEDWKEQEPNLDPQCISVTFTVLESGRFFCFVGYGSPELNMAWSDDKGKSWKLGRSEATSGDHTFGRPVFRDGQLGLTVLNSGVATGPTTVVTRDGGETWTAVRLPQGVKRLLSATWVDAGTIEALGDDGQRLRSADGGQSWTALATDRCGADASATFDITRPSLRRLDDRTVLLACSAHGNTRVLLSRDGAPWQRVGDPWPVSGVGLEVLNGQAWALLPGSGVQQLQLPPLP